MSPGAKPRLDQSPSDLGPATGIEEPTVGPRDFAVAIEVPGVGSTEAKVIVRITMVEEELIRCTIAAKPKLERATSIASKELEPIVAELEPFATTRIVEAD